MANLCCNAVEAGPRRADERPEVFAQAKRAVAGAARGTSPEADAMHRVPDVRTCAGRTADQIRWRSPHMYTSRRKLVAKL